MLCMRGQLGKGLAALGHRLTKSAEPLGQRVDHSTSCEHRRGEHQQAARQLANIGSNMSQRATSRKSRTAKCRQLRGGLGGGNGQLVHCGNGLLQVAIQRLVDTNASDGLSATAEPRLLILGEVLSANGERNLNRRHVANLATQVVYLRVKGPLIHNGIDRQVTSLGPGQRVLQVIQLLTQTLLVQTRVNPQNLLPKVSIQLLGNLLVKIIKRRNTLYLGKGLVQLRRKFTRLNLILNDNLLALLVLLQISDLLMSHVRVLLGKPLVIAGHQGGIVHVLADLEPFTLFVQDRIELMRRFPQLLSSLGHGGNDGLLHVEFRLCRLEPLACVLLLLLEFSSALGVLLPGVFLHLEKVVREPPLLSEQLVLLGQGLSVLGSSLGRSIQRLLSSPLTGLQRPLLSSQCLSPLSACIALSGNLSLSFLATDLTPLLAQRLGLGLSLTSVENGVLELLLKINQLTLGSLGLSVIHLLRTPEITNGIFKTIDPILGVMHILLEVVERGLKFLVQRLNHVRRAREGGVEIFHLVAQLPHVLASLVRVHPNALSSLNVRHVLLEQLLKSLALGLLHNRIDPNALVHGLRFQVAKRLLEEALDSLAFYLGINLDLDLGFKAVQF